MVNVQRLEFDGVGIKIINIVILNVLSRFISYYIRVDIFIIKLESGEVTYINGLWN